MRHWLNTTTLARCWQGSLLAAGGVGHGGVIQYGLKGSGAQQANTYEERLLHSMAACTIVRRCGGPTAMSESDNTATKSQQDIDEFHHNSYSGLRVFFR